jgi:hypothetical protein
MPSTCPCREPGMQSSFPSYFFNILINIRISTLRSIKWLFRWGFLAKNPNAFLFCPIVPHLILRDLISLLICYPFTLSSAPLDECLDSIFKEPATTFCPILRIYRMWSASFYSTPKWLCVASVVTLPLMQNALPYFLYHTLTFSGLVNL